MKLDQHISIRIFSCHLGRLVVGKGLPREQNNWIGGAQVKKPLILRSSLKSCLDALCRTTVKKLPSGGST